MTESAEDVPLSLAPGMLVGISISTLDKPTVRMGLFEIENKLRTVDGLDCGIPSGMGPGADLLPVAEAFIALGGSVGGIVQGIDILWKWLSVQRTAKKRISEIQDARDVVIRLRTKSGELVLTADSLPQARRLVEQAYNQLGTSAPPRRLSVPRGPE